MNGSPNEEAVFRTKPPTSEDSEKIKATWRRMVRKRSVDAFERFVLEPEKVTLPDLWLIANEMPHVWEQLGSLARTLEPRRLLPNQERPSLQLEPTPLSSSVWLCSNKRDRATVDSLASALLREGFPAWTSWWSNSGENPSPKELQEGLATTSVAAVCIGIETRGPWDHLDFCQPFEQFIRRRNTSAYAVLLPNCSRIRRLPGPLQQCRRIDLRRSRLRGESPAIVLGSRFTQDRLEDLGLLARQRAARSEQRQTEELFTEEYEGELVALDKTHFTVAFRVEGQSDLRHYPLKKISRPIDLVRSQRVLARCALHALPHLQPLSEDEKRQFDEDAGRVKGLWQSMIKKGKPFSDAD